MPLERDEELRSRALAKVPAVPLRCDTDNDVLDAVQRERSSQDVRIGAQPGCSACCRPFVSADPRVIGFMVATRTREIAVRIALGASRRRVLGTIQFDVVTLVIPGLVGGFFMAIILVPLVVPWRGLSGAAMEPLIYALGVAIALFVALLAGLPSARRAASVEPMIAMRSE